MACDPNQSDFIVPIEYENLVYTNITQQYSNYLKQQEYDRQEEEAGDNHDDEETLKKRETKQSEDSANDEENEEGDDAAAGGDTYQDDEAYPAEDQTDRKKHTEKHHVTTLAPRDVTATTKENLEPTPTSKPSVLKEIVTKIKYYIKEEFIIQLIESCR